MKVQYFNFSDSSLNYKFKSSKILLTAAFKNHFILGKEVDKFEEKWSKFIGVKHSVGVSNGYDGLVLALKALNLPKKFTVAVPAHTFIASWYAIHSAGGIPVGIDVDEDGLIDLNFLENIYPLPNVVMPVHMHGRMVNMPRLCDWARKNSILIIEDASQSHGAKINQKHAGTWGELGVFSLYPSKNLGAFGDAAVVATNSSDYYNTLKSLRNYGSKIDNKYVHELIGQNSRLDTIQAAILNYNLDQLNNWNIKRKIIANQYLNNINGSEKIKLPNAASSEMVWHHFVLQVENRNEVQNKLTNLGIQTEIHYPKVAGIEYLKIFGKVGNFPRSLERSEKSLSLPINQWLTKRKVKFVISEINKITAQK